MTAVEQHRRLAIGGGKLKPARRGLVGRLYLGDHAGERPIAQAVLGKRQHLGVLAPLRIEDAVRPKPHLFQSRRVKVEARQCPEHSRAALRREPRRDTGGEQGRSGIVAKLGGGSHNLMQPPAIEAAIREAIVNLRQAERQRRSALPSRAGQLRGERGKLFGAGSL